jgi:hypothetical protein
MVDKRHYIGQLDFDFEPRVLPCMWDLSSFSGNHHIGEHSIGAEAVEMALIEAESEEITRPLNQLVDFYDRFVYPDYWSGCSD